ncbi:2-succinyl-5-enolpyruvyl-6-hydroxy-3-cyclohexene-1-carboxylate synthase [Rhynchospora pubera]|uniref:2-succinyl-5-enolpyruvyl-6-hydroxy-3-cyclohexene-1-carboxylate synthase n=1 Tax=Rhynchospora pubera TaxID=906938 RepID=A0AAV8FZS4_9POAL|nr:2-succinyl-5-enolpyruvyl-6-hydroxy-3-cyclohexene-1-carboxylate synthase [Rhynchospora pubera]
MHNIHSKPLNIGSVSSADSVPTRRPIRLGIGRFRKPWYWCRYRAPQIRQFRQTKQGGTGSPPPPFIFSCISPLHSYHQHRTNPEVVGEGEGGLVICADDVVEEEQISHTHIYTRDHHLRPCLTITQAVAQLKQTIQQLNHQPPSLHYLQLSSSTTTTTTTTTSGVIQYQVLLPPSAIGLDWLCSRPTHLPFYPHFYFSSHHPTNFLTLSSFGHALCIHGACGRHKGYRLLSRYLSSDALTIQAYGFTGLNPYNQSQLLAEESDSFYLFIPQIQLKELDGCSVLAVTLIWDDSFSFSFERAVSSLELCLDQMGHNISSKNIYERERWMSQNCAKENVLQSDTSHLVCVDAVVLDGIDNTRDKCLQKEEHLNCAESYVCISPACSFSFNMFHSLSQDDFSIKECSNMNMVWASLIVEELVRLGINYFCIAPGSRSSPLAINATRHPLTNCISCYDERSLAFHALGYAQGSQRPAVIITSSGTAVSNLHPAVVEASQNFIPTIILTADRPPELLDCGANQAIDQVNHFGKFVRQFSNLCPPTDEIFSRTVLTTIDSSVYLSTNHPMGPTHINCQFREPLHDSPLTWSTQCLTGLEHWLTDGKPYTRYINTPNLSICTNSDALMEVLEIIKDARKGILIIGRIFSEADMWALSLIAKQLSWPVVADVLSGLRVRRLFLSHSEDLFVDYMDHALLSDTFKDRMKPDVVLQIGGSLTSKRISQFLESCAPIPYILVDSHPYRHDPSHIVTYRIQSSVSQFVAIMFEFEFSKKATKWTCLLKEINSVIEREIGLQIQSDSALTEPYVAHAIAEVVGTGASTALFVGNSMVIRDLNMYAKGSVTSSNDSIYATDYLQQGFHGIPVAANRGASGIDGLVSTVIGFSVGSQKRVYCLVGDVSFLHDTNGLSLLNQCARREPITIVVVNNHGGAIFSLLPVAEKTQLDILNKFFYTSHDISLYDLCSAHKVKHILVRTKQELQIALQRCANESTDSIVEVVSSISKNAEFHCLLRESTSEAMNQAMEYFLWTRQFDNQKNHMPVCRILKAEYKVFRMKLSTPPTSAKTNEDKKDLLRDGLLLRVTLDDDTIGFGEIMPIEIHEESFSEAELQVRFLLQLMNGCKIDALLPLLNGSFSHWIWRNFGIPPSSIFPSVRCGLEMAILNALAAHCKSNLSDLLLGINNRLELRKCVSKNEQRIEICALVDCEGSPSEVAHIVSELVQEGYSTVKLKVARRRTPIEDAMVIQKIRETVGYSINIRVDANRRWSYAEAMQFASAVKEYKLQYIEEPIKPEHNIIKFCEDSGLPVALDETLDAITGDFINHLQRYAHPGITAMVIKPSRLGGFENTARIAKWACLHNKMAIVSSAYESSLTLSVYVQFAYFLHMKNENVCKTRNKHIHDGIAHGLGTYKWIKEEIMDQGLKVCVPHIGGKMGASVKDSQNFIENFCWDSGRVLSRFLGNEEIGCYSVKVGANGLSSCFRVKEAGLHTNKIVVVFLHGFLGTSEDWAPIMKSLSSDARMISVDLPGHGKSQVHAEQESSLSVETISWLLQKLVDEITTEGVVLVGYSMGARIAMHMTLNSEKVKGAVIISGSPGLKQKSNRRIRQAIDKSRANLLMSHGLQNFLKTWYSTKLWSSLREHPHFNRVLQSRTQHDDIETLAKVLHDSSVGKQRSLWDNLKDCKKPLLLVAGEKDSKFVNISHQIRTEIMNHSNDGYDMEHVCEVFIVPNCGHAVHLENPLPLIHAIRSFLSKVD